METNLYTSTVVPMTKILESLLGVLDKGSEHAKQKQLDWQAPGLQESNLLQSHLIFNQFPLVKQIQIACDNAKGGAARLAGIEAPAFADDEKTFEELKVRINKTLAFLKTITAEQIVGQENRTVKISYFPGKYLTGFDYAMFYLMPNFYFHVVTAYSIFRQNGVELGKSDYMSNVPWQSE